jgi:hypothetical protein
VDGHRQPGGGPDFGDIILNIKDGAVEVAEVLISDEVNSTNAWTYLLYAPPDSSKAGNPLVPRDPQLDNPDFFFTWYDPFGYFGPPDFENPGPSMLGFGDFFSAGVDQIQTDLWHARDGAPRPPLTTRRTAYLNATIIPQAQVDTIRISGIIDDGAIFYLDFDEIARYNMSPGQDGYNRPAAHPNEAAITMDIPLGFPLQAGFESYFAVSLHNVDEDSCDLGMKLKVESLIPSTTQPPPNDFFVSADLVQLDGDLPLTAVGRTHDLQDAQGATEETGEPDHAGNAGGASIWWRWTPTISQDVTMTTFGSNFDTLLAVYTGNSVSNLTEIASSSSAIHYQGTRLSMNVSSGTTYHVVVDGFNDGSNPVQFGDVFLTIDPDPSLYGEIEDLILPGSDWFYLLYTDSNNIPVDPVTVDADFYSTWYTTGYNGPAFMGPGTALLGYGSINADPIVVNVWGGRDHSGNGLPDILPPGGLRKAVFFKKTITPANPVTHLGFEGLVDDGAVIYINGVEAARMNVAAGGAVSNWDVVAKSNVVNGKETEDAPQDTVVYDVNLLGNMPIEIGVMVVSDTPFSSDLAFDLRVFSADRIPVDFVVDINELNSNAFDIFWESVPGGLYDVESTVDYETWRLIAGNIVGGGTGMEMITVFPTTDRVVYRVHRRK